LQQTVSIAAATDPQDPSATALAVTVSAPDRVFPTLTAEQVARIAAHRRRRPAERGELLVEVGDRAFPLFVVVSGEIEAVELLQFDRTIRRDL
jgi:CRP-like cAMP-binding protein